MGLNILNIYHVWEKSILLSFLLNHLSFKYILNFSQYILLCEVKIVSVCVETVYSSHFVRPMNSPCFAEMADGEGGISS